MRTSPWSYNGMAVSPCTAWCAAYARPSPRHASPWSVRRATGAQRLASAGTLVRVLAPPVKAGISQGRQARRATASYHAICGARYSVPHRVSTLYVHRIDTMLVRWFPQRVAVGKLLFHTLSSD